MAALEPQTCGQSNWLYCANHEEHTKYLKSQDIRFGGVVFHDLFHDLSVVTFRAEQVYLPRKRIILTHEDLTGDPLAPDSIHLEMIKNSTRRSEATGESKRQDLCFQQRWRLRTSAILDIKSRILQERLPASVCRRNSWISNVFLRKRFRCRRPYGVSRSKAKIHRSDQKQTIGLNHLKIWQAQSAACI